MESQAAAPQPVICEVCGTFFETRRGLSSHARLHLRQLGVTLSENSGAPIELLYQLISERDGCLPYAQSESSKSGTTGSKKASRKVPKVPSLKEEPGTSRKTAARVATSLKKTDDEGSPAPAKESSSSLLPSFPSGPRPAEGSSSSSSSGKQSATKPLWAPRETDAPITLDTSDEVHVCQLCGCWYGTRKGLSGHARTHLHQLGISDNDIKGSPIQFLCQIMEDDELKLLGGTEQQADPTSDAPAKSSSKRPSERSSLPASPGKRVKASEDCTCSLCGEEFENRKGLSSHARSHLREIGVGDLVGKRFAIDALRELVSSGILEPLHPGKTKNATDPSAASSLVPAPPGPSPSWALFSPPHSSPIKSSQAAQAPLHKAPKAKKGFRLAVDPLFRKPKLEPVETEVSVHPGASGASGASSSSPVQKSPGGVVSARPPDSGVQAPPTVLCDYCGQLFETRKALSCHARAHLRQLGLTWSIKSSPIDLLREVMMHHEESKQELLLGGPSTPSKWAPHSSRRSLDGPPSGPAASSSCSSLLDFSMQEKLPPVKDTSCELCGFDFENRKALASHARAHLRQLGIIEWRTDGATSPIELLSDLIRKDPNKVSQITRRYRMGDLYIKKSHRSGASPSPSTDSDYVPTGSLKASYLQQQQHEQRADRDEPYRHSQGHARAAAAAHSIPSLRSPRGVHPPKHKGSTGPNHSSSQQPARSGGIPALLPKPPLTPLVKLEGKIYSLKCRFCEEVFRGPLSVQEQWIAHLQKHILSLGYKGTASPPATPVTTTPVTAPTLVPPVAV